MRRLIQSEWYQQRWGDKVKITSDQNAKIKFETLAGGFRQAVAAGGITGSRGDRVIIDDAHSVESAASEAERLNVKEWFLEAIPTRLNNPVSSAIIVIEQRLHEDDVSGIILNKSLGYEHVMLPMEFDPLRRCQTSIGFKDIREEEGELLFPERFPAEVVERDKAAMGPYAVASQFQMSPAPRGGGIIKRDWWMLWDDEEAEAHGAKNSTRFPQMDYIIASFDGAYTTKQENDASALTVWGIWQRRAHRAGFVTAIAGQDRIPVEDDRDTIPCAMLMAAWEKRLPIHGGEEPARYPGEDDKSYLRRRQEVWGICEWISHTCNRFKVDLLLIESKANGMSVADELKRLNRLSNWGVRLINPGNADKVARAYAVQASFSNSQIWAPDRSWADSVITQCEVFPKGLHDDLVDSTTQGIKYLRETGRLTRSEEIAAQIVSELKVRKSPQPVYDV
jgi:predicted phage terminase large subunit-like protein